MQQRPGDDEHGGPSVEVDVTLIDETLRLTPAERLRQNDRLAALAVRLQQAFLARKRQWPSRGS